jgi:RNA polymerase sigma-70 factor (ECF subfamily)
MDREQAGASGPEADTDANMVVRALRDTRAYAEIVRRFEWALKRYVRRLLGSHAQHADDILQDIFVKAYVNLNGYDRSRPLAPWLYRIAHNEAVSFLRKYGARPLMISGEDGQLLLERLRSEAAPQAAPSLDCAGDRLDQALVALQPHYRDVLVLRYLEERSYDEIADILEMPPGTVATRIRRGLERLRVLFASGGDHERYGHE